MAGSVWYIKGGFQKALRATVQSSAVSCQFSGISKIFSVMLWLVVMTNSDLPDNEGNTAEVKLIQFGDQSQ